MKGVYKNEVEKPEMPMEGKMIPGMGMGDFKGEGDPIIYGQASKEGCTKDMGKMKSQMKDYHWD